MKCFGLCNPLVIRLHNDGTLSAQQPTAVVRLIAWSLSVIESKASIHLRNNLPTCSCRCTHLFRGYRYSVRGRVLVDTVGHDRVAVVVVLMCYFALVLLGWITHGLRLLLFFPLVAP